MYSLPFLGTLTNWLGTSPIDDGTDSLSCLITAFLYIVSAILISTRNHVGNPMECWIPRKYSSKWSQVAETYCFLKDTYWYPDSKEFTSVPEYHKELHKIQYYQWTGMYLTIAGIAFMIPKFLWNISQSATDVPLLYFCDTTKKIRLEPEENRKEKIAEMAKYLRQKITSSTAGSTLTFLRLYSMYSLIKMLYLLIACLQFVVLAIFIGQKHDLLWGWNLLINISNGVTWHTTGMFPRIVFCDFQFRIMDGSNRQDTIQCSIGINEFNEKIFMFLWFWLIFLILTTFISFVIKFKSMKNYTVPILSILRKECSKNEKKLIQEFDEEYITFDGKVILCYVRSQSEFVFQELLSQLFEDFIKTKEIKIKEIA